MNRFDELLHGLVARGFELRHREATQATVTHPGHGFTFVLLCAGEAAFVHIAQVLVDSAAVAASSYRDRMATVALLVHSRFLGGRFGFDEDGCLSIQYDVYPECQNADHVATAMAQLNYLSMRCLPLFEATLESGQVPDETAIDLALDDE